MLKVISIVGGHGEVTAVPELIRKLSNFQIENDGNPIRCKEDSFLQLGAEFTKFCSLAANKARQLDPVARVLIFVDADDEGQCPAMVAPRVISEFKKLHPDIEVLVCMMKREFETMFLFCADSLAGISHLPKDIAPPVSPEAIRGAKEWLSGQMGGSHTYRETQHQLEFVRHASVDDLMKCPSVARIHRHFSDWLSPSLGA